MKAWLIDGFDGVENLRLGEVPDPEPGEGQVRLRVQFAAPNPADYYLAANQYPARPGFPHILGRDGIGIVEKVGPGVETVGKGDQRLILRGDTGVSEWGTFAEKVVISADRLAEKPIGWSDEEAAGASLVYLTAWQAITHLGPLPERCTTLITGASGGVGTAGIELAHALGHRVIAVSRSEEKRRRLLELGVDEAIDATSGDLAGAVKAALGEDRVDLAIDSVGGSQFNEIVAVMGKYGRISCVGRLAGEVPSFNTASLFFRRIHIRGVGVYDYSAAEAQEAWAGIVATLARTGARPTVDQVFDFEQLPEAFARLMEGPMGKVVVTMRR